MIVGLMAAFTLLSGCSLHEAHPSVAPRKIYSAEKKLVSRCKIVGKKVGKYTTVLIRRNCLRAGKTEVVVWFHALKSTHSKDEVIKVVQLGTEEATKAMIKVLGFKPALALLPIPKVKGYFSYVFLVVGVSP